MKSDYLRIWKYALPYRFHLITGILASFGVALATWADTECVKYLIGHILTDPDPKTPIEDQALIARLLHGGGVVVPLDARQQAVVALPVAIAVIHLTKGILRYVQAFFVSYAGARAVQDLREAVYGHVLRMPVSFFADRTTGDLQTRIIADAQLVQGGFILVVKNLIQNAAMVLVLTVSVLYINLEFGAISLIGLPLAIWPVARLGRRLRTLSGEGQRGLGRLADQLQETFTSVRVVKAYASEERECARFHERSSKHLRLTMRGVRLGELSAPIMEALSACTFALLIYMGGSAVLSGEVTAADFGQILVSLGLLYVPIKALVRAYHDLARSFGAAERIFELMDLPTERERDLGRIEAKPLERELRFERVSFTYPGGERPAIQNLDLHLRRGEVLALVGRSGSGKSTIAHLLLRLYDPTAGRILWDGRELKEYRLASLRPLIGWVGQEVMLFDGSVRENILYGRPSATEAELVAAATAAHALEFIERMPEGFATQIGERGVRLSGGQKQRLSIARTLLANPPILILDEATSALDAESESIVQAAIEELMAGRTTILIAHRLSTIQNAHRVVVLDQGQVVEQGTIPELLARSGAYAQLARADMAVQQSVRRDGA